ncbi:MAG: DUF2007 domain-containing protein [Mangrovimonas sp.]|nr:DUF2007 domain-containing protein [Mangrovimonas sp.]MCB0434935.1 DUF2007 domain-containing protein [Mangrovimonas sp.]
MSDSEYVKVFAGNLIDSENVIQNLEEAGIEPIVKNTSLGINAALATDYQDLREIYVHETEVAQATSIIEGTFPKAN